MNKWTALQNGSDIRGVVLEGIKNESITLTPDIARTIAWSFATWLKKNTSNKKLSISVGNDSRLSAQTLKDAVFEGIAFSECIPIDCGLASTPAMFMSTQFDNYDYDGSIMLTASHLPFNRNGLKFFTKKGGLSKDDISEILILSKEQEIIEKKSISDIKAVNLMKDYSKYLVNFIREKSGLKKPLEGLNIIVDAGNGSGGFFVYNVLNQLGANTNGSQFLEPDGSFPNHIPDPENKEAMEFLIKAVKKNKSDLGIIFDTDVDRAGAVDKNGLPINRNRFIALMASIVLEEHPGTTIVTDSVTSSGLTKWIEKLGGIHHRFKRGYKNVINESIRLNKKNISCELALETSGHGALKENYFLDDGAYQISKILIKLSQLHQNNSGSIDELIEDLEQPKDAIEFRPIIKCKDYLMYADKILVEFNNYVLSHPTWNLTKNNYEGVHVSIPNGWILIRKSLHDPKLPINIESNIKNGSNKIKLEVVKFLRQFDDLEIV